MSAFGGQADIDHRCVPISIHEFGLAFAVTLPGTGLPVQVDPNDWVLMPRRSSPIIEDADAAKLRRPVNGFAARRPSSLSLPSSKHWANREYSTHCGWLNCELRASGAAHIEDHRMEHRAACRRLAFAGRFRCRHRLATDRTQLSAAGLPVHWTCASSSE